MVVRHANADQTDGALPLVPGIGCTEETLVVYRLGVLKTRVLVFRQLERLFSVSALVLNVRISVLDLEL